MILQWIPGSKAKEELFPAIQVLSTLIPPPHTIFPISEPRAREEEEEEKKKAADGKERREKMTEIDKGWLNWFSILAVSVWGYCINLLYYIFESQWVY